MAQHSLHIFATLEAAAQSCKTNQPTSQEMHHYTSMELWQNLWQDWKVALVTYHIHGQFKRQIEAIHKLIICPPDASHSLHALQARPSDTLASDYLEIHAVLCCAVLCCAVLCCAVLCCAVLCCAGCTQRCSLTNASADNAHNQQGPCSP